MTEPGATDPAPSGTPEDGGLVARVLDGDTHAYALLVQRHQSWLHRYARSMGLDEDTARDMIQDALVKAYERLRSCRNPERFGLWVGRILRNRCLDHLKSAPQQRTFPLSPELPSADGNPERHRERRDIRNALRDALDALPPEQREAFLLKHGEGRSYEEMAELTGTSQSALKMRVHRARDHLRDILAPFREELTPVAEDGCDPGEGSVVYKGESDEGGQDPG